MQLITSHHRTLLNSLMSRETVQTSQLPSIRFLPVHIFQSYIEALIIQYIDSVFVNIVPACQCFPSENIEKSRSLEFKNILTISDVEKFE